MVIAYFYARFYVIFSTLLFNIHDHMQIHVGFHGFWVEACGLFACLLANVCVGLTNFQNFNSKVNKSVW